jgi:hypothetical protein
VHVDDKSDAKEPNVVQYVKNEHGQRVAVNYAVIEEDLAAYKKRVFEKSRGSYPPGPEGDKEASEDAERCAKTVREAVFGFLSTVAI